MNNDPQATPAINHGFEEEMEGLFDNSESADRPLLPENLDEFNDLMEFFEDDPASSVADFGLPAEMQLESGVDFPEEVFSAEEPPAAMPQRMVLSLEGAEADLEALFDTANEADIQSSSTDPYKTASWLEIDHLMAEQSVVATPANRGDFERLKQWSDPLANEWDDLQELLSVEKPFPMAEAPGPAFAPIPLFYDSLAQWDGLLEQGPNCPVPDLFNPNALESLLSRPAGSTPKVDAPAPMPIQRPVPAVAAFRADIEDEFKDLEALLEQADQTMGGPPAMVAVGGQPLPSQRRATTAKLFEQTMRVPVKQLDNLSNLIGELVIKRNRLEQDQERLRQFLDNLLNQTQSLSEVGDRMHDLHERTLLEGALLASRQSARYQAKVTYSGHKATVPGANTPADKPFDALEMDRFTGFHLLSQEMIELIVRVRESASDIQYLVDETDQLARSLRK